MLTIRTSPTFLPEKSYLFHVLLDDWLGIPYHIEWNDTPNYELNLPNGRTLTVEDHFFGYQHGETYLENSNIPETCAFWSSQSDPTEELPIIYGRPQLIENAEETICGLDLFASTFFMLSRWEEYVRPERDAYDRFPAGAALAVRAGFIDRPACNQYAELLWQMLLRLGWSQPRRPRRYRLLPTHDVDHPRLWWQPQDRLRTLAGSLLRRGSLGETRYWLQHLGAEPYDSFDDLMDLSEAAGTRSQFNFMGRRAHTSDAYYPLDHPFVRQLIKTISARGHVIGFHPSLEAYRDANLFQQELDSLQSVSSQPVRSGRHHYLCFAAPHTWQRWEDAGLEYDSTLGYSEAEGFRCGACYDFPVFNFLERRMLRLREQPLIAMDVTLALYRRYTPEEGARKLQHLLEQVRRHQGVMTVLWHNSSWNTYFWAPWREVYAGFLRDAGG